MPELIYSLLQSLLTLEGIAVVLAIAYLLLAARESLWCWYCAFGSSLLYILIFRDVRLLMESMLSVYYAGMALVGWWQWQAKGDQAPLAIIRLPWWQHVVLLTAMLLAALVSGSLLRHFTDAAWPFVDSFTTWA